MQVCGGTLTVCTHSCHVTPTRLPPGRVVSAAAFALSHTSGAGDKKQLSACLTLQGCPKYHWCDMMWHTSINKFPSRSKLVLNVHNLRLTAVKFPVT